VKGSGPPPADVVVTPPTELLGADETVLPTELEVVSRLVVVTPDEVVVPFTVVVVPFTVVVVAPEVLVAPLVVVPLTVVVVAPLVDVAPEVLVAPLVVVPFMVVVVVPLVVVAPDVVVAFWEVVVAPEVVVAFSVVVVVPPVGVAEASCATLTPATTRVAMITSQPAVRLCTFFACLAIDAYLLSATTYRPTVVQRARQARQPPCLASRPGGEPAQAEGCDLARAAVDGEEKL